MASPPSIDPKQVANIAALARLELEPELVTRMAEDLGSVLGYVQKLDELDTSSVEPTTGGVTAAGRLRPDEVRPGLTVAEGLQNAPDRLGDGFGVPKVIE